MSVFTVKEEFDSQRIDKYLSEIMPDVSRSRINKAISDGESILLNSKPTKPSARLKAGDLIEFSLSDPEPVLIEPEDIPLDIIYEDRDVLIVNKPKDMVVHPAPGHYSGTLVNAVMYHCRDSLSGINGELRPGIVHRIDKDTTGILVVCKNDRSHSVLAEQLAEHSITRIYLGICCGNIKEDHGTVDKPIGRNPKDRKKMAVNGVSARRAVTHYRVLERYGRYTLAEFKLETGRTHQIRVHMASINHPLLGDEVYGAKSLSSKFSLAGQCLHARTLGFVHPESGKYMEFQAEPPEYFLHLTEVLRQ